MKQILDGKSYVDYEKNIRLKNGSTITCLVRAILYRGTDGKIIGIIENYTNITEWKIMEDILKESEEKYQDIIENLMEGYYEVDLKGNFTLCNKRMCEYLGYPREELIGVNFRNIITKKNALDVYNKFNSVYNREVSRVLFDSEIVKSNDSIAIVENSVFLKYNSHGKRIGFYGLARDITEKRKAEQKVEESEMKFRYLFENSPNMIVLLNTKGKIIDFNLSILHFYGYNREDFLNKEFSELNTVPLETQSKLINAFKEIFKKGKIELIELQFYTKEENIIWVNLQANLVETESETYIQTIVQDITKRKKAEEKLKLSEKKYREAYNQINFYKDLFTHDISNILSVIYLSSELCSKVINDPEKSDKVKEYMHIINEQIGFGTELIRNVQKLSKIENTIPQIQSIEIQKVLNEAIEFLHKSFQDRNIEINVSPYYKKFYTQANELLFDVFGNILNNAVKYNDSTLVDISVKISNAQKENIDYLKIEFRDNGIGISNTQKEFIFKKGYKEHKGSKGMGFGLSLVKKIIESYNGQIWVEDRVKGDYTKGSNFVLLIPEII